MPEPEHVEILKRGVDAWNEWRDAQPYLRPDLSGADLQGVETRGAYLAEANLSGLDFSGRDLGGAQLYESNCSEAKFNNANLAGADMSESDCSGANFNGANLTKADLRRSFFFRADLIKANMEGAELQAADFRQAYLMGANLRGIYMGGTDFTAAALTHVDFTGSTLNATVFGQNYLDEVIGLDSVSHNGPSIIGIETIYLSQGGIPEAFLRGCGVPDELIAFLPSLLGAQQAVQFYSCFISYNTKDEDFARRLYSRMRDEHLRAWFAPEDVRAGEKLYEQIDRAIQIHDRLLIVLSESSLKSKWVMTEIRRARSVELRENRRKLFPIRLVDFDALQAWECFDADTGEDLAAEVRQYFIPDFSVWKDHNAFERAFERLLRDLRAEEKKG